MKLATLGDHDIIEVPNDESLKIMEYKISRTLDRKLILEIKMDISDSIVCVERPKGKISQE